MFVKTVVSGLIKDVELRAKPIIVKVNKFDEESAEKFVRSIGAAHNTGQKIIPVIVDSFGGTVYSLMAMISAIKGSDLPIATIVQGKAMSCGAVLTTFGEDGYRYADPDATVMIHDVSSSARGKIEELKADTREAERLNERIYTMMAQNCGKADDYFLEIVTQKKHADWFMDAKEAKKHNLVNHLRVPKLTVSIDVNMKFD